MVAHGVARFGNQTANQSVSERKIKPMHNMAPWFCMHVDHGVAIKAYVMAAGDWQIVASVPLTKNVDAEVTAGFIADAVNQFESMRVIIRDMTKSLEACLACALDWETEQRVYAVIARAEQILQPP